MTSLVLNNWALSNWYYIVKLMCREATKYIYMYYKSTIETIQTGYLDMCSSAGLVCSPAYMGEAQQGTAHRGYPRPYL